MTPTATTVETTPGSVNGTAAPAKEPTAMPKSDVKALALNVLHAAASLRITVTLFAVAMVLVFWGTLAQADAGIWTVVATYFRGFIVWVPIKVICFNCVDNLTTRIPFPGGMTLGAIMLVNLLAAHAVRFKLKWNRAGIFLIHAGIIVMMLGELLTGLFAVEQQMAIYTGQTVNYVYNTHKTELAIIRTIDAKTDDVIVVPGSLLTNGAKIQDEKLPFDIEVLEYMVNSGLDAVAGKNRATRGIAVQRGVMAKPLPEVPGAEPDGRIDAPSVYVRLSRGDRDLGTWLFSVFYTDVFTADAIQEISVDGKTYRVSLRFEQSLRPYSLRLDKVTQKVHPGTTMASDYRSYVHLKDPTTGYEQDVQIYMNAPLFYRGETFYQAGVSGDPLNPNHTTLQVVQNPGWVLPYASCAIVGFGLLIHFGYTLFRFLQRRAVS